MKIGSAGVALLKEFEQCRLVGYYDEGGVPTVGWGHTGPEVKVGMILTQTQADEELIYDLEFKAVAPVNMLVTKPLDQNQFDALCVFVYNIGPTAFRKSTIRNYLNSADYANASREFPKWDLVKGVPSAGLLRRRQAEQTLFCAPV